jgi:hypothetical protein
MQSALYVINCERKTMFNNHDDGNITNNTPSEQPPAPRTAHEQHEQSTHNEAHAPFTSSFRSLFDNFLAWCNSNIILLKGLGSLILGLFMIFSAFRMIIGILFFLSGITLVYYGLRLLGINQITDAVENIIAKLFNRP